MKPIVLALIFCAGWIQASDQASDREAIHKTVVELRAFTADFDNQGELSRLSSAAFPVVCPEVWGELCWLRAAQMQDRTPVVIISSEPWGEATISIHGPSFLVVEKIRFLTPEVALVDAYARTPLLIILRKEAETWKIASIRILAEN
jgi:hypothetical protein